MPVIQPRALEISIGNLKSQGLDQMQNRAGRRAGARDVPGILRDFGMNEYDIHIASPNTFFFHKNCPTPALRMVRRDGASNLLDFIFPILHGHGKSRVFQHGKVVDIVAKGHYRLAGNFQGLRDAPKPVALARARPHDFDIAAV